MITEDYVSFETAKLLKEKGFDCACKAWYAEYTSQFGGEKYSTIEFDNHNKFNENYKFICHAPTLQMAMKWLREEKDVQIEIAIVGTDTCESPTKWMYGFRCQTKDVIDRRNEDFSSYEQACEAAIKYCLENLI